MAKHKGCDVRKFIISEDGEIRIGGFFDYHPYLHKELLYGDKTCYGGGYCYVIPHEKTFLMYGKSTDYGAPQFDKFTNFEGTPDWKFIYKNDINDEEETVIDTTNVEFCE